MLIANISRACFGLPAPERSTGFFDLPLEIREDIYERCLTNVLPAKYIVYRNSRAGQWSYRGDENIRTPPLLLVSKAIRDEAINVLYRTTDGPTLRINPMYHLRWRPLKSALFDKADETQPIFDLAASLTTIPKLKLEVSLPSKFPEQAQVLALLRWLFVSLSSEAPSEQFLRHLNVELILETLDARPSEEHSFWQIFEMLQCAELTVECVWRHRHRAYAWDGERIERLCWDGRGGPSDRVTRTESVESARRALVESCKEKGPAHSCFLCVREALDEAARPTRTEQKGLWQKVKLW